MPTEVLTLILLQVSWFPSFLILKKEAEQVQWQKKWKQWLTCRCFPLRNSWTNSFIFIHLLLSISGSSKDMCNPYVLWGDFHDCFQFFMSNTTWTNQFNQFFFQAGNIKNIIHRRHGICSFILSYKSMMNHFWCLRNNQHYATGWFLLGYWRFRMTSNRSLSTTKSSLSFFFLFHEYKVAIERCFNVW